MILLRYQDMKKWKWRQQRTVNYKRLGVNSQLEITFHCIFVKALKNETTQSSRCFASSKCSVKLTQNERLIRTCAIVTVEMIGGGGSRIGTRFVWRDTDPGFIFSWLTMLELSRNIRNDVYRKIIKIRSFQGCNVIKWVNTRVVWKVSDLNMKIAALVMLVNFVVLLLQLLTKVSAILDA